MGASRYMAIEPVDFSTGSLDAGTLVAANHRAVAEHPEAFVDGDRPQAELDAVLAEVGARVVGEFDPSEHTVEEVRLHLAGADDVEAARVSELERQGKARAGILEATQFRD